MTLHEPKHPLETTAPARLLYVEKLGTDQESEQSHGLLATWELIHTKKWTLVLVLISAVALAGIITLLQSPMYRATSTVEILQPGEATGILAPGTDNQSDTFIRTQLHLIESNTLKARVAEHFAKAGHQFTVRPSRIEQWAALVGLTANQPQTTFTAPPVKFSSRVYEGTHVAELTAESADPQFSAEYLDTVAKEFGRLQSESHLSAVRETSQWIAQQIEETKENLRKAESQLEDFSRSAGKVYGADQQSADQVRLTQMESELSRASADRFQKEATFNIAKLNPAETIPGVADNVRISDYVKQLADLRRDSAELRTQLTPEHYKVQRLDAQIREVESTIQNARSETIKRIQNEYEAAVQRERLLRDASAKQKQLVDAQAAKSVLYDVLNREVDSDRKVYDELLEKSKAANLASAMTNSSVRVIDAAEVPFEPYSPTPIRNVAAAVLCGIVGGIFLIVLSDHLNVTLKVPGDTPYHLRVPELGIIPTHEAQLNLSSPSRRGRPTFELAPAMDSHQPNGYGPVLVPTWSDGSSALAESVRGTVASILSSRRGGELLQVILVASSGKGDGKSTTVASLGVAFAEVNQKVLLIDADLRKPQLHRLFSVSNSWGLSSLLLERTSLKELPLEGVVQSTGVPGLGVLPAGPGTATIAHLLYSKRLDELVERVRMEFDVILIDTPPMSLVSDARVLGRVADAAVLVVRAGHTKRDEALAVKDRLVADRTRLIGTVLNRWNPKLKARYAY
jgi:succinoglycan biosynthesis transport protein ExoP